MKYPGVVLKWRPDRDSFRFAYATTKIGRDIIDALDAAVRAQKFDTARLIYADDQGDVFADGMKHLTEVYLGLRLDQIVVSESMRANTIQWTGKIGWMCPVFVIVEPRYGDHIGCSCCSDRIHIELRTSCAGDHVEEEAQQAEA